MSSTLIWQERLHYRDRLRSARYAALADAEGFDEICFVLEALGLRLSGAEGTLNSYFGSFGDLSNDSDVLHSVAPEFPTLFNKFPALYKAVQAARNDCMHSGVYARHATESGIALCIGLEEALMKEQQLVRITVGDFMVRSAVVVHPWQPVAYARQLMLMHSFSFLPVYVDGWKLIPEMLMAKYLPRSGDRRKAALGRSIREAIAIDDGFLELLDARVVAPDMDVAALLRDAEVNRPTLWLVEDGHGGLAGVLSPFELM
ncbi:hypothetical protein ACVCIH_06455 [Burkholderia glumae]